MTRSARVTLRRSHRACTASRARTRPRSFLSSSAMMPFRLAPNGHGPGRPLLEEGPRALPVVLAVEGGDAQVAQVLPVGGADSLEDRLDLGLRAAYRERRVGRDLLQVVVGVRLELRGGNQPLDEADAQ